MHRASAERVAKVRITDQYPAQFYLFWFFKCYQPTEHGWIQVRTPDGGPMSKQDHLFTRCLEVIGRTMNEMISEERRRAANKGKGKK